MEEKTEESGEEKDMTQNRREDLRERIVEVLNKHCVLRTPHLEEKHLIADSHALIVDLLALFPPAPDRERMEEELSNACAGLFVSPEVFNSILAWHHRWRSNSWDYLNEDLAIIGGLRYVRDRRTVQPVWCEHIYQRLCPAPAWLIKLDRINESYVKNNWTVCPICVAKRPEEEKE